MEKDGLENEKSMKELKRENDQMREDMREFQRQLEAQRDTMISKSGEDSDVREAMRQKNQEMLDQLDEIRNLSLANKKLQDEVEELSKNLEIAITEMEQMTTAHNKIKGILAASDVTVDQLTRMNDVLQERIDELEYELSGKRENDEEIMAIVSDKIQQWKDIVAKKDEQLEEKEREVNELRGQLGISNVDMDRNSFSSLQMVSYNNNQQIILCFVSQHNSFVVDYQFIILGILKCVELFRKVNFVLRKCLIFQLVWVYSISEHEKMQV